jgi:hypothetical protein
LNHIHLHLAKNTAGSIQAQEIVFAFPLEGNQVAPEDRLIFSFHRATIAKVEYYRPKALLIQPLNQFQYLVLNSMPF